MAKDCRSCKEVERLEKALAETERKWRKEKARADKVEWVERFVRHHGLGR